MADKPAIYSWTEDPSGQQWFFSSSGWTQVSGTSGDGFVEWDRSSTNLCWSRRI